MSSEETTLFDVGEKTKQCKKCGDVKPLDSFGRERKGKFGRRTMCYICDRKKASAKRQRYKAENAGRDPYDGTIKRCPGGCGRELPRTRDYWQRTAVNKDGLQAYCRKCQTHISGDIVGRIGNLWGKEKGKNRGEWVLHSKAEWLDLLISQRGRCALSGVKLTPSNVSVDHIVPCSKGGGHELSNLRLVTNQVNKALWDGSDEDLFEMARAIWFTCMNLLCYGTKENPGA